MRLSLNPARFAGLLLVAAALVAYLLTLDNGLQSYELRGGDLITHHYAQVQARFANAPGYPLYSMGGWLWFHSWHTMLTLFGVQQPNPIPILSSYSTLWAIPALWLFYRLILRYSTSSRYPQGNWPIAWLISAFFGATYFFWYYATTSEQYSSAVAQTLAILFVYGLWSDLAQRRRARSSLDERSITGLPGDNKWLYLLAFLCGLSLAHMLTVAFIVPPLVAVMLYQSPGLLRSLRAIAGAVAAAAAPLLSYLFVYMRGAQYPEWRGEGDWRSNAEWFWTFVGTDQGRDELSWGLEPGAPFFGNGFPELIWQELSVPLLLLGILGIAFLPRRVMWILYPTLLIYLFFCWAYRLGNWFQVIIPAYPLILLGTAVLLARLEAMAATATQLSARRFAWPQLAIGALLLIALLWRIDASLPAANSRNRPEDTGLDRAALLLDAPLPSGTALFAPVDDALALQYLTQVWRIRSDLRVISSDQAANLAAAGIPLAATWASTPLLLEEMGIASGNTINSSPPLLIHALSPDWILILDAAQDTTALRKIDDPTYIPLQHTLHENIILHGYVVTLTRPSASILRGNPRALDITLFWSVLPHSSLAANDDSASPEEGPRFDTWTDQMRISVRPLGPAGYLPINPYFAEHPEDEFAKADRARPAPYQLLYEPALQGLPLAPLSLTNERFAAPASIIRSTSPRPDYLIADPYRFWPAPETLESLRGVEVILYQMLDEGFENLAIVRFDLEGQLLPP